MTENQQFLLYTAPDGVVKIEVFLKDETVWLTQKALAELFGVKTPAVNKHLKNIFESGELSREATITKMEIVRAEVVRDVAREMEFYNLDAIIAVGYRVNSYQATKFRIWAITGQTAAELIYSSADAAKVNMGLSTWKQGPRGKILKSDVAVAKNYLNEAQYDREIKLLEGRK